MCLNLNDLSFVINQDIICWWSDIPHEVTHSAVFTKVDGASSYYCFIQHSEDKPSYVYQSIWVYHFQCLSLEWCSQAIFSVRSAKFWGDVRVSLVSQITFYLWSRWGWVWCVCIAEWLPCKYGFILNTEKCMVQQSSITFFVSMWKGMECKGTQWVITLVVVEQ